MRIVINTLAMRAELYGVDNYIIDLISALARIDPGNEYFLFASWRNIRHLRGLPRNACGFRGNKLYYPFDKTGCKSSAL